MGTEQLLGGLVMTALGVAVAVVGDRGRRGRLDDALGAWTRATATPESWAAAHRTIGGWFLGGGCAATAAGLFAFVASEGSVGPLVVAGSIAMLVLVVVGVVAGAGRFRRR